jgi:hypothetical protein
VSQTLFGKHVPALTFNPYLFFPLSIQQAFFFHHFSGLMPAPFILKNQKLLLLPNSYKNMGIMAKKLLITRF